jgi:hypothetical protein
VLRPGNATKPHKMGFATRLHELDSETETVYGALLRMTRHLLRDGAANPPLRPGPVLFEGSGNLGTPDEPGAHPFFTAFRLTEHGAKVGDSPVDRRPLTAADALPKVFAMIRVARANNAWPVSDLGTWRSWLTNPCAKPGALICASACAA